MDGTDTRTVRVAIVEDHPLMVTGLQQGVEELAGYRVTVVAEHGEAYIAATRTQAVDIALVDLRMPVMDGYQTLAWMREHQPEVRRVAFSYDVNEEVAVRVWRCGAHALLDKGVGHGVLHEALTCVRAGGLYRNKWLDARLLRRAEEPTEAERVAELLAKLSGRERECLRLLMLPEELSEEQIAARMDLSPHTVREYHRRMNDKLGVKTRLALVRLLTAHGSGAKR